MPEHPSGWRSKLVHSRRRKRSPGPTGANTGTKQANDRFLIHLAWGLTALGFLLLLSSWVVAYLGRMGATWEDSSWQGRVIGSLSMAPALLLGGVLAARKPRNLYGWVWLSMGFNMGSLLHLGGDYAIYALLVRPELPGGWVAESLAGLGWFTGVAMLPYLFLLYPTGTPPSPRWRILSRVVFVAWVFGLMMGITSPGESGFVPLPRPYVLHGPLGELVRIAGELSAYVIFLSILPAAASLFSRFRRASGVERAQLKWLAYGAWIFTLTLASDFLYTAPGVWENIKEAVFFSLLPVSVGIAILRHRLWDIDLIIRRTLQYTLLTGVLGLVYFGAILTLQNLFVGFTAQQSPVVVVISTLIIAALFSPLRARVQAFIDGRFYRQKYNTELALARFAASARDEVDLDQLSQAFLGVVRETIHPASLSLWLNPGGKHPRRPIS